MLNRIFEQSFLKKLSCGVIKAHPLQVWKWNNDVGDFVIRFLESKGQSLYDFTVDVKVHMLMPGQYPCIPGWHLDLVPRDYNKKQMLDKVDPSKKMYLLVSGPPITEFRDGRKIVPGEFTEFTQLDEHRGTPATEHCWRMFIRIAPASIHPRSDLDDFKRRHCQVYLDAENFKW